MNREYLPFPFCPQPPHWSLDWEGIERAFDWMRAMRGVPQEPLFHAEGDVLTHTRLVCEQLVMLPAWRDLTPAARETVFSAALLHDSGKPARTRMENGRITSAGHARLSAAIAGDLFWQNDTGWQQREAVASLVRAHGLPLQFLDREDIDRALVGFSLRGRNDHLALLAEADVQGRICADQPDLLARVDLFREQAQRLGCLDTPFAFPSNHSRFQYFQTPGRRLGYHAYEDTACEVVLLSGLPGAGKDTWTRRNLPDLPVISLDSLRQVLGISPTQPQSPVIAEARQRAQRFLRERQPFVWNATNISRQIRQPLIQYLASQRARIRIVYLEAPWDEMKKRNAARPQPVPEAVMETLRRRLEVPDLTEATKSNGSAPPKYDGRFRTRDLILGCYRAYGAGNREAWVKG